jgi:hypothetical protein
VPGAVRRTFARVHPCLRSGILMAGLPARMEA